MLRLGRLQLPLAKLFNKGGSERRSDFVRPSRDPVAYRVLIDSLFSSPTTLILGTLINVLIPLFCWYATADGRFVWLAVLAFIAAAFRVGTVLRFRARGERIATYTELRRWDIEFFLGATASSLLLGAASIVALAGTDSVACHLMTVGSSISFASGYVARNAGRPKFVIVQLLCFCTCMVIGLLFSHEPLYEVIAVYIVLFFLTSTSIVYSINRNLLKLAAATRESQDLAQSLTNKNVALDSALDTMTHGLCLFRPDRTLEIANGRFVSLYGLAEDQTRPGVSYTALLNTLVEGSVLEPRAVRELLRLCHRVVDLGEAGEQEIVTKDGRVFLVSADCTSNNGLLILTEDATARKMAAAQMERMARCDTLTGLANRFRFNEVLKAALEQRTSRQLALLYVDLDDFKGVNDTMGHEAGDALLLEVGRRLAKVGDDSGFIGRFGGDEFLMLCDVADASQAEILARRVLDAVGQPILLLGNVVKVTTSIGIALGPQHGSDPSDLMRAADMALYAAKAAGRNGIAFYTHDIAAALSHRRRLEQDLREAERANQLALVYQPVVDARTDEIRSYEALMRWRHPVLGNISPADFIPIAEQTGMIGSMGAWALRQACRDATRWPEQIAVAVNVSAIQFRDPERLIETVRAALAESGLRPNRLVLEVTESLLIADQATTLEAMQTLRSLGVQFALDDFGSGYSSLGYLAKYPFAKVKIDRSFAEHLTTDSVSRSIIEVTCQLAIRLGMRVVVEGIETEAQRREIVALGAEQAQGWLFGKPLPVEQLNPKKRRAA